MELLQFWSEGLAQASYLLVDGADAIAIDPALEAEWYLDAARERGAEIRHVLETHVHADFVSGNLELAALTGASLWVGPGAGPAYRALTLEHGVAIPFGTRLIQVRHTPGHTPDSVTLVVPPAPGAGINEPHLAMTGDTLFVGDVGRPDLAATAQTTITDMAHALYASLQTHVLTLPDNTRVYPAHGAGSLCGKSLSTARSSTIGAERLTNPALRAGDEDAFVRYVTSDLPLQPQYFARAVAVNRRGATSRAAYTANLRSLPPAAVAAALVAGAVLLDARDEDVFPLGHIPGSISVAVSDTFGPWAGTVLPPGAPVILLCAPGTERPLALELQRVACEPPVGYLAGGFAAWHSAGFPTATLAEIAPDAVAGALAETGKPPVRLLDVRSASEFEDAHVTGAHNLPLTQLPLRIGDLDAQTPYLTVCASGYRSVIAASVLRRAGFVDVRNVCGGMTAIREARND